ncbi:Pro-Pol polyprotein [Habropoda laboriosa]|uniref:RNA-directed DNA polymerase n=1 Tax=Habropoda laboriosa TaxID=597456 RepID=A0A0L7QK97_9HYME|nr:Pro-Pol polyprotein [Habropoda laboriosa]
MQAYVIRLVHEQGHFTVIKTEQLWKRNYWFSSMRPKIEKVIRSCLQCVLATRKTGRLKGYLHPIYKGDRPLETYHIDHLGSVASTRKNYRHLLVVANSFTKFIWLYPTKSTTSVEVIDRLSKKALFFGNPRKIISDRGIAFSSHDFADYCKREDVQHIMITTGIPRANGQVERVNRTLIPLLMKLEYPQAET